MISKNKISLIRRLKSKKKRFEQGLFVVEGIKMVDELGRSNYPVYEIFHTIDYLLPTSLLERNLPETIVSEKELKQISYMTTPNSVLALVRIPEKKYPSDFSDLTLVLDNVQDPGNLGTIIRTADWFGIKHVVASENTADIYNPKVVQASMGSIFRVEVIYTNLLTWLPDMQKSDLPIYGMHLQGKNLYQQELKEKAVLVLGNESKGISEDLECLLTQKIKIPSFPQESNHAESLNVASANAIFCAEFRRRQIM